MTIEQPTFGTNILYPVIGEENDVISFPTFGANILYPVIGSGAGPAPDAVRTKIEAMGGLLMGYDMSTATAGVKQTADLMVGDEIGSGDIYGNDNLKYSIVDGAPVNCGSSSYISKTIQCGNGAATSQIGAAAAASGIKFMWGIVECDFDAYAGSWWGMPGGTVGSPNAQAYARIDTNKVVMVRNGGTVLLTASPAPTGTKSYFFAIGYTTVGNNLDFYLCDLSATWASRQTANYFGNQLRDGVVFTTGFGAPNPNGSKWVPGSQHSTEWAESDIEELFNACKA